MFIELVVQVFYDTTEQACVIGAESCVIRCLVACPDFSSIRYHQVMRIINFVGAVSCIGGISVGRGGGVDLAQGC